MVDTTAQDNRISRASSIQPSSQSARFAHTTRRATAGGADVVGAPWGGYPDLSASRSLTFEGDTIERPTLVQYGHAHVVKCPWFQPEQAADETRIAYARGRESRTIGLVARTVLHRDRGSLVGVVRGTDRDDDPHRMKG